MLPVSHYDPKRIGCYQGWQRFDDRPLMYEASYGSMGGELADPSVIRRADGSWWMAASWIHQRKLILYDSPDGQTFGTHRAALYPKAELAWEQSIAQPSLLDEAGAVRIWYAALSDPKEPHLPGAGCIGCARMESDGRFVRFASPALTPGPLWEGNALGDPCVLYDAHSARYLMWYSGGQADWPEAIGCAESADGVSWTRLNEGRPVLTRDSSVRWERERVGCPSVAWRDGWYYMLYVGFEHEYKGRLCLARSRDGIRWQRHPGNPIATAGRMSSWDCEGLYRSWLISEPGRWRIWYTGRRNTNKNIGLLIHEGEDLGFDAEGGAGA